MVHLAHVVVLCFLGRFTGWCKCKQTFKLRECFQSWFCEVMSVLVFER